MAVRFLRPLRMDFRIVNVVFFGTASFGLPTLAAINASDRHRLIGLVTGMDKPKGRGQHLTPTPVGRWAMDVGLAPVLKPERLGAPDFITALRTLPADVYVVVAFRILPESVFTIPRYALNLHASLLPAYRGAAPIQRALMAGETQTGVTTFLLAKTVDSGAVLVQRTTDIDPDENAGQLADRLAHLGAEAVIATLDLLATGQARPLPQDDARTSQAPKITSADLCLDLTGSATEAINRIRALAPEPGAVVRIGGQVLKVLALRYAGPRQPEDQPGEIVLADPRQGIIVATADGRVAIERLQAPGKRAQTGAEFVRGHRIQRNDRIAPPA
ncbi:MAG: methionyl-tRNA formyltransferase [Candidatus Zixiibacteriota bacterium]